MFGRIARSHPLTQTIYTTCGKYAGTRLTTCRNYAGTRLTGVHDNKKVWDLLKHDFVDGRRQEILPVPRESDVLVIGGM